MTDASPSEDHFVGTNNPESGATSEAMSAVDAADEVANPTDASRDAAAEGATGPLEAIHYYGRWAVFPAFATTVNSGSHVTATFHGTGLSARFNIASNMTHPERDVADRWRPLERGRDRRHAAARHRAYRRHARRSLWYAGSMKIRAMTPPLVSSVTFQTLDVTGGAIDLSPRPIKRKIEFLGDSITEGVNTHKAAEIPKDTPTWRADGRLDYSCQTALALDAEWRQVGFGRQGLTIGGNGGVPVAQDAFNFIYANMPRDSWQADMVVINQGTNDGGANSQTFRPLYVTFLERIRAAYPNAQIAAMRPFAGAHADDIKNAVMTRVTAGDVKVFYIDTTGWITERPTPPTAFIPTRKVTQRPPPGSRPS